MEKVKEFFMPSYWLGGGGTTVDSGTQTMINEAETRNPPNSCLADNSHMTHPPQSDVIIIDDGTQSEKPMPSLPFSKKNEEIGQAWKKNMISLNEDLESGPSQAFQSDGSAIITPESTSVNALHNTKLFIPASLNTHQHSTPLKKNGSAPVQSGSESTKTSASDGVGAFSEQQETTVRKESTASSSVAPQLELHQSGSMLTPPGMMCVCAHAHVSMHVCIYMCTHVHASMCAI